MKRVFGSRRVLVGMVAFVFALLLSACGVRVVVEQNPMVPTSGVAQMAQPVMASPSPMTAKVAGQAGWTSGFPTYWVQSSETEDGFLLTIFLKHDQSKTLDEIAAQLEATGFWQEFPPAGMEVTSWYVMMGIGQVVTLRVPPERLREVNLAIERNAWGAFRTEFYPTYDFLPLWESRMEQQSASLPPGSG